MTSTGLSVYLSARPFAHTLLGQCYHVNQTSAKINKALFVAAYKALDAVSLQLIRISTQFPCSQCGNHFTQRLRGTPYFIQV